MGQQKFAAFDIDGTIFRSGLYREVIFELARTKKIEESFLQSLEHLREAWRTRAHEGAFREFEHALALAFDKEITRIKVSDFEAACMTVIQKHGDSTYRYTRDLVTSLKREGYYMIAISGSQEELVRPFAEKYGFDAWVGQHYERGEEFFTGHIVKTHEGKDVILRSIIQKRHLTLQGSVAVGDSSGDIGMLNMVENPIAFNPDSALFQAAKRSGWKIVVERKNVVHELEQHGDSFLLAPTND